MVALAERVLHIRFEGESRDIDFSSVGLSDSSSDSEVREAAARALDTALDKFSEYRVDRTEKGFTVRPEAVFG